MIALAFHTAAGIAQAVFQVDFGPSCKANFAGAAPGRMISALSRRSRLPAQPGQEAGNRSREGRHD